MKKLISILTIFAIAIIANGQQEPGAIRNFAVGWAPSPILTLGNSDLHITLPELPKRFFVATTGGEYRELMFIPKTYIIAPNGSDNNAGTITAPFKTLNKAWAVVQPGDSVIMRGGNYAYNEQVYLEGKSGTPTQMIHVLAYPGEKPVITKGNSYTQSPLANNTNHEGRGGCYFSGDYVHFKGLRITGFTQTDNFVWNGLLVMNSNNNFFEQMEVDNNGAGMYIQGSSTGNLVLNSDFHHNYDPITFGGNADGLDVAMLAAGTSNIVRGCRFWFNSDDGGDAYENLGFIWFDGCWSWGNGWIPGTKTTTANGNGVGFKLGTAGTGNANNLLRKVTNCLAFDNRLSGFHQEEGDCRMQISHNASFANGQHGYLFNWLNRSHIIDSNYAFNNTENNAVISLNSTNKNNAYGGNYAGNTSVLNWQNIVAANDFISIIPSGVDGPRNADGSLPNISFMKMVSTSDVLAKGIGPIQGTTVPPPPVNNPPTANAGPDQTLTLPNGSVTLNGTGTDSDGTISSYLWTDGSVVISGKSLSLTFNSAGSYTYNLTVTDDKGATGTDQVTITVKPAPPPPVTYDTTYCSMIQYVTANGTTVQKKNVSYIVNKNGVYYDNTGTKVDVSLYKGPDGKWKGLSN